jgi:hypothetical protein
MGTEYVGKAKAAAESFVRTFIQAFVGALVVVNWQTTDLDAAKAAVVAAGAAALAAAVAAVGRLVVPIQTDKPQVAVAPAESSGV